MNRQIFGTLVILLIFFFAAEAAAQPFGRGRGLGRCLDNLNLTNEQQQKIDQMRDDHFNRVGEFRDELDKLRIEKRQMMRQSDINRSDYIGIEKKMSALREKIQLAGAEFRMDVYAQLDKEQKEQFSKGNFRPQNRGKAGGFFRDRHRRGFCW